jgi:hypothetical protein
MKITPFTVMSAGRRRYTTEILVCKAENYIKSPIMVTLPRLPNEQQKGIHSEVGSPIT